MARAIELEKFLSSKKKEILPPPMMSQIIQDKSGYIAIYEHGHAKKSICGRFWCAWSKFDRGKKMMTKSAHTIGISNNISSKTCSYLIYPMHYKMWLSFLFSSNFKWNRKDGRVSYPYGEITANTTIIIAASSTLMRAVL